MKKFNQQTLIPYFSKWNRKRNVFATNIKRISFFILAISISALCSGQQAGDLDSSFSNDGKLHTDLGINYDDWGSSVAIQTDGKIIVAGYSVFGSNSDFSLVRYNTDGSLDTSFSDDGIQITAIGNGDDEGISVAIQDDGKIVLVGRSFTGFTGSSYDFAIVRYNSDGSLDNSFSGNGKLTTAVGSGKDQATCVAIQTDGKIVVAGYSDNGINEDFALIRYNSNGSLDVSFSGNGKQTTSIGSDDICTSVAIQTDGKIVLVGYSSIESNSDFALVRYNPDGSLDTTFSGDGIQTTAIGSTSDQGNSVAIQSDGKIVVAGYSFTGADSDFALVRYNPDGSLDNSFSLDGIETTDIGINDNGGFSVAIQADGKIVVAGYSTIGTDDDFALVRYNNDGSLDNSFSEDGIQTSAIVTGHDRSYSVAIQADGKIVVAGNSRIGTNTDFSIARYIGVGTVGINEQNSFDFSSTSVFPNPFQHTTTLKIFGTTEINSTLLLYNSLGQIVHTQAISSTETVLHLELASGLYSYSIINEKGKLKTGGKLVIQ